MGNLVKTEEKTFTFAGERNLRNIPVVTKKLPGRRGRTFQMERKDLAKR